MTCYNCYSEILFLFNSQMILETEFLRISSVFTYEEYPKSCYVWNLHCNPYDKVGENFKDLYSSLQVIFVRFLFSQHFHDRTNNVILVVCLSFPISESLCCIFQSWRYWLLASTLKLSLTMIYGLILVMVHSIHSFFFFFNQKIFFIRNY